MPDRSRFLGRRAEERIRALMDRLELLDGFDLGVVLGQSDARAELRARFQEKRSFLALPPSREVLSRLERRIPTLPPGRPVVWIEGDDLSVWKPCLAALNEQRDRLRAKVSGLVLLAGPFDLEQVLGDHPDLASVVGSTARLDEPPGSPFGFPMRLRWLHLSDLHFDATSRWERRAVLTSLLRFLKEDVVDRGLAPHLVFVTGDVANKGQEPEYGQAEEFLGRLMETLGLDARRQLFLVPGNHDVDRSRIDVVDEMIVDRLTKTGEDGPDPAEIERVLSNARAVDALSARLEAFYSFTRRLLGPTRGWDPRRPWRADTVEVDGLGLGIFQLNTAWASGPDDDKKGRLLLGGCQVREALAELPGVSLKLALLHHPLAWLAPPDEREVAGVLRGRGGVDMLLTGHLHDTETVGRHTPDGATLEMAAGATYTGGKWPLGCCLVDLDGGTGGGTVHFYGYTPRGGGFWHLDNSRYAGAPSGTWSFPLPGGFANGDTASADPGPDPAQRLAAQVARYRSAAVAYHARVSFLGLSVRDQSPQKSDVWDLFVPLVAGPRGQQEGGLDPVGLVRARLELDEQGRAARFVVLGDPGSGKTSLSRALG
ncbi:MAG: metallophosphoesterase, partial [Deltaproteobacteria bacterium]|nr:metallophosphoesterase [Deltaproteobacteria bacterium]